MASRAVPAILPWPGADTIYSPRWIHSSPADIAEVILDTVNSHAWSRLADTAFDEVSGSFPLNAVCDAWADLLVENVPSSTASRPLHLRD
jgi:hypothetical protein